MDDGSTLNAAKAHPTIPPTLTATTTATASSRMPMLLPPSPSHRVHFETTCVVIPEVEEQSLLHLEKRSLVLPSWRRQRADDETPPAVITVKVPSISRKHRRLHSAERTAPLQPCLRHSHSVSCSTSDRDTSHPPPSPSASNSHKPSTTRRASLNAMPVDRIPLRECCTACIDSVQKGLEKDYHEHWSKGAQRRRRMSESELAMPSTSTPCSSAFLKTPVKVDEIETRKSKRHPNAPARLPPAMLEHLCADDDESMLFPLPSPRRTPSETPKVATPSGTPPKDGLSPSPRRAPSPNSVAHALSMARLDDTSNTKPLPRLPSTPPRTGRELLAQYPDVDVLPSRRIASESATDTLPSRRPTHALFRTVTPTLRGIW
ncbi:hypothetical protein PIIN_02463 [Serendipita indica DSM 11827]|uniref:Uncharacterized protein n=1 Tax=Serendipita indica (strain DSM 11827) TaxID=1109443 RepID=G4TB98_SERID|nr:hypothetical protein PIIN_02463 [Serendipita indica DSM 11827]